MAPVPEKRGSRTGSPFKQGLDFIFEKHKKKTSIASYLIIPLLVYGVFSMESSQNMLGEKDIQRIIGSIDSVPIDPDVIDEYMEKTDSIIGSEELNEGSSKTIIIPSNQTNVIKSVNIDLKWTDEQDMSSLRLRRFENQPDSFSLNLDYQNGTAGDSGDAGSLSIEIEFTIDEMKTLFGKGNFTVTVTLDDAGDWVPPFGPGFITVPDTGNSYDITIQIVYLVPKE